MVHVSQLRNYFSSAGTEVEGSVSVVKGARGKDRMNQQRQLGLCGSSLDVET